MVAIDAQYHAQCLISFYNRGRQSKSSNEDENYISCDLESLAFAEVVSYIEECGKSDKNLVFQLCDLKTLYIDSLNDDALRRWMVAGPETARMLSEYKEKHSRNDTPKGNHHEQVPHMQKLFLNNVKSMITSFEDAGNPFADTSQDLCP